MGDDKETEGQDEEEAAEVRDEEVEEVGNHAETKRRKRKREMGRTRRRKRGREGDAREEEEEMRERKRRRERGGRGGRREGGNRTEKAETTREMMWRSGEPTNRREVTWRGVAHRAEPAGSAPVFFFFSFQFLHILYVCRHNPRWLVPPWENIFIVL